MNSDGGAKGQKPAGRIDVTRDGAVLRLTIDNPARRNAIGRAMYLDLAAALADAAGRPEIRVVILSGAGGMFTSGNDVSEFEMPGQGEPPAAVRFIEALMRSVKPVIAQVEGLAIGIGVTMLLHCDLVYATPGATFRLPFVNLGLVPEAGASFLLPARLGRCRASELILLGEAFPAETARDYGLVNDVCPADEIGAHVRRKAERLAAQPPEAVRRARDLLRNPAPDIAAQMDREVNMFRECLDGPEFAAAASAFMNRPRG